MTALVLFKMREAFFFFFFHNWSCSIYLYRQGVGPSGQGYVHLGEDSCGLLTVYLNWG